MGNDKRLGSRGNCGNGLVVGGVNVRGGSGKALNYQIRIGTKNNYIANEGNAQVCAGLPCGNC